MKVAMVFTVLVGLALSRPQLDPDTIAFLKKDREQDQDDLTAGRNAKEGQPGGRPGGFDFSGPDYNSPPPIHVDAPYPKPAQARPAAKPAAKGPGKPAKPQAKPPAKPPAKGNPQAKPPAKGPGKPKFSGPGAPRRSVDGGPSPFPKSDYDFASNNSPNSGKPYFINKKRPQA